MSREHDRDSLRDHMDYARGNDYLDDATQNVAEQAIGFVTSGVGALWEAANYGDQHHREAMQFNAERAEQLNAQEAAWEIPNA